MLERIISNRLTEYLEANELFYPRQIGFRKGYSTTLAISKFVSDVNLAQNDNNLTDCIYIYTYAKLSISLNRIYLLINSVVMA